MNSICKLASRRWPSRFCWVGTALSLLITAAVDHSFAQAQSGQNERRHSAKTEGLDDPIAVIASASAVLQGGPRMPRERKAAVVALGKLGPAATEAIPMLEQQLTSRDADVAFEAYRAIGLIRNELPLERASLLESGAAVFTGGNGFRAFQALNAGTLSADEALPLLREVVTNNPPAAQHLMALETMGRFSPGDSESVRALLSSVASSNEVIFTNASAALSKCSVADPHLMDLLARALVWQPDRVSIEAARVLARFGPRASPYVPALLEVMKVDRGTNNFRRVGAYLHVLRAIGPAGASARPELVQLLSENAVVYQGLLPFYAKSIRRYVLLTLADVGTPPEAIPTIIDEMSNTLEPATIAAAARAAGALTAEQEKIVSCLKKTLARRGLDAAVELETIEFRTSRFSSAVTSPYLEIIRALERIGPAAKDAVPLLRARARDPLRRSDYCPPYQQAAARAAEKLSL